MFLHLVTTPLSCAFTFDEPFAVVDVIDNGYTYPASCSYTAKDAFAIVPVGAVGLDYLPALARPGVVITPKDAVTVRLITVVTAAQSPPVLRLVKSAVVTNVFDGVVPAAGGYRSPTSNWKQSVCINNGSSGIVFYNDSVAQPAPVTIGQLVEQLALLGWYWYFT